MLKQDVVFRLTAPAIRLNIWLRGLVFRWLEPRIQAAVTERILLYNKRLIQKGFIPDLPPSGGETR
jgi:hypothetical protein